MRRALLFIVLSAGVSSAQNFQNVTNVSGTANPGLYGTNLAWGDYDADGALDLYVTNWGTAAANPPINALYHNEGDGTFTDRAADAGVDNNKNSTDNNIRTIGGYG